MIIFRWTLLRIRNVSNKSCIETSKQTFYIQWLFFFRKWCPLWDNVEKCGGARGTTNDVTTWGIRLAWWISKATCTHKPTRPGHTHARAHTHTNMQYLLLFHSNNVVLLYYTYTDCLVQSYNRSYIKAKTGLWTLDSQHGPFIPTKALESQSGLRGQRGTWRQPYPVMKLVLLSLH